MEQESLNEKVEKINIQRQITVWIEHKAKSPKSLKWMNAISFAESSFFPIPPDPFLSLLVIAEPKKWLKYSLNTTAFSVMGGLFGYLMGYLFFSWFGQPIVDFYDLHEQVAYVEKAFHDNAFWALLISAFTPIPYKIFTISAGLFGVNLLVFIAASILGRGFRFILVGYIMKLFGKKYGDLFFKKFNQICFVFLIILALYLIIF